MFEPSQSPPASSTIIGVASMLPLLAAPTFANLPSEHDRIFVDSQDCKRTTPCVRAGDAISAPKPPLTEIVALRGAA
jgi:hypothetical protein